jgi:hypothetical protein
MKKPESAGAPVYTTGQVARICGVTSRTVAKWFDAGWLRGYKVTKTGARRIYHDALLAFLQAHEIPVPNQKDWPVWLRKAKTQCARIEITRHGEVIWHDGLWKGGTWCGGTWRGGHWRGGTWRYGAWEGGLWHAGTWHDGFWCNGLWFGGTWRGGRWSDGTWLDGTWLGGEWRDGTWKHGTWKHGTWYGGTWHSGIWRGGTWHGGLWYGGRFLGGERYVVLRYRGNVIEQLVYFNPATHEERWEKARDIMQRFPVVAGAERSTQNIDMWNYLPRGL